MDELPSGTVSMLFSDIEGSTVLLNRLGPGYPEVLERHRAIMRGAWAAYDGAEMGTEGDSFFVVFATAGAAVRAALRAQRGLAEQPWPEGVALRTRIGIHTGSPQLRDGNYWGMDVHRAARIAGAAHGGQLVASATTVDLARAELPVEVVVRDLGLHHLKDLPAEEHLYQLAMADLQQDFPPVRSIGAATSLPHPATPLVGRDSDVTELTSLLQSHEARLLTLTGAGGSGKTRLAVAAAERLVPYFPDGVYFVPLASVTTAEVLWSSIADALDVPARERSPARLLTSLAPRSMLLVLDNLEQVSGADEVIDRLLDAAPATTVVATSRQSLGLTAERLYDVPPLALPADVSLGSAEAASAVQLFVQRARSVQPRFRLTPDNVADVVAICRRLDGLPLAIELGASRIRVLSPKALLGRLDRALDFGSTSKLAPPRQRTLRATIAWSAALLTPAQQAFFRRLSVFAGGADLDAIATVTSGTSTAADGADPLETVEVLVDANLTSVAEGPDGEPRVTLLETIRDFAWEELATADEVEPARALHAEHFTELAERLQTERESEHLAALGRAETELDNFRVALDWADVPAGLRLCAALGWVWFIGGYVAEGRRWHEHFIAEAAGTPSPRLAACLAGLANLLLAQGEAKAAGDTARRSLIMARLTDDQATAAFALGVLGTAELQAGDVKAARVTIQEALEAHRRQGDRGKLARALGNLAGIEESLGSFDRAEQLMQESLQIFVGLGDQHEAATQQQNLANLLALTGRAHEAAEVAQRLIDTVLRLRSPNLTMAFANTYMNILIRLGDPGRAAELFGAEEGMRERLALPNPYQDEELAEALDLVAGAMSAEEWEEHRRIGHGVPVEDLLAQLRPG